MTLPSPHVGPPTPRPQVLLVEDDASVRRSLQLMLEGEGYRVRAFSTASALLADSSFAGAACLVTDYRLGEQDGISLLRSLRKAGWSGPAILMTAFTSHTMIERAMREGFVQLFDKPFRPHLLIEAVARAIAA
ncbi:FixJ family two-component response regulator [Sphingobium xanthum]|jgi:FixJ family two-component response regulator|uniref:response regulator transcription factor n=1 Tax=Sphingobium xanthum TaxID=1387165 RepID=UPI001C8C9D7D|nr:response regulator [Sphingobium xanthum]